MRLTISFIIALLCVFTVHVGICLPFYLFQDWESIYQFTGSLGYQMFLIFYGVLGATALGFMTADIHEELWGIVL